MVHSITRVSVIGIAVITAALVILIAAFNGIEGMVTQLYSEYDAALTVRSNSGKTFKEETISIQKIATIPGVIHVNRAIEETVILKHQQKWVNARLIGVDENYLLDCNMSKHMVEGYPNLTENGRPTAIIGATLLDKLEGYISELDGSEELMLYTPLRDASISKRKSPFKISPLTVVGRMNYNREVNMGDVIVPLDYARLQLNYTTDLTALYIEAKKENVLEVKSLLEQKLGKNFTVKTAAEKNELIFKTSESEKRIVIIILVFVFILAAFNLVASLNMLFIEKKENIQTLMRIGAQDQLIFRVFFFEGLLIAAKGIIIGLLGGTVVCVAQWKFKLLEMPNSAGEAFPLEFTVSDGLLICGLVSGLSILCAYLPVWYLVKKARLV